MLPFLEIIQLPKNWHVVPIELVLCVRLTHLAETRHLESFVVTLHFSTTKIPNISILSHHNSSHKAIPVFKKIRTYYTI